MLDLSCIKETFPYPVVVNEIIQHNQLNLPDLGDPHHNHKILFQCRVAIVTGGTRNIGGGISKELALRGAHVAMIYQNPATSATSEAYARELEGLGGGGRAVAILADVTDAATPALIVKETLEKLNVERIDIVGTYFQ